MGAYEFGVCQAISFQRGDADARGSLEITDGIYTLSYLFLGGPEPPCHDAADTDDSGAVDLSDAVGLFRHLFLGGVDPRAPFSVCGVDPTVDALDCDSFSPCE